MKHKKLLCLFLSIFFLISLLSGCSLFSKEKVLKICLEEANLQEYENVISYYEHLYPNIKIETVLIPSDFEKRESILKNMKTKAMSGDLADLFLIDTQTHLSENNENTSNIFSNPNKIIYNGIFADLSGFLEKDEDYNENKFIKPILQAGQVYKKQFVIPLKYVPIIVATDDNEFYQELQNNDYYQIFDLISKETNYLSHFSFMYQFNSFRFIHNPISYEKEELLISKKNLTKQLSSIFNIFTSNIKNQETSENSSIDIHFYKSIDNSFLNDNYNYFPMKNDQGKYPINILSYVAISSASNLKQEAYNFIKLLMSKEVQSNSQAYIDDYAYSFDVYINTLPIRKDSFDEWMQYELETSQVNSMNKFMDTMDLILSNSDIRFYSDLDTKFFEITNKAWNYIYKQNIKDKNYVIDKSFIEENVDNLFSLLEQSAIE